MERKRFIELCMQCALLPKGAGGVKKSVPENLTVTFGGNKYYPSGYQLMFDDKAEPIHTAILHDLRANGVVCADLGKVSE